MTKIPDVEVPTTITELRDDLLRTYAAVDSGHMTTWAATEKRNAANKIVESAALQLEYAVARGQIPNIHFLE